jgi:hypothetical protein
MGFTEANAETKLEMHNRGIVAMREKQDWQMEQSNCDAASLVRNSGIGVTCFKLPHIGKK